MKYDEYALKFHYRTVGNDLMKYIEVYQKNLSNNYLKKTKKYK